MKPLSLSKKRIKKKNTNIKLPLFSSKASCGFTSPADDYIEKTLSLDDYLVPNPNATFFVRASGESMKDAGISNNDLLIIDRSLNAKNNDIILAIINNEFTIKRFTQKNNTIILKAENKDYDNIIIQEADEFSVWGIVTHVIHNFKNI